VYRSEILEKVKESVLEAQERSKETLQNVSKLKINKVLK